MKRHTLINNSYSDNKYTVTIGTDIGTFTGEVICRPEDQPHRLDYFGWQLAEIKAEIQYTRAKSNYWKARAKALTEFWRDLSATRTYNPQAFWVKKIRKACDHAFAQIEFWSKQTQILKEGYHDLIVEFDATHRTLTKKGIKS